jgi:hypothetical protein
MNVKITDLFPNIKNVDLKKIKINEEGLYSITRYKDANYISKLIYKFFNSNNITITDATSNVGGNTISFCLYFNNVNAIEINNENYKLLKNNI